jgi:hypothetical protein
MIKDLLETLVTTCYASQCHPRRSSSFQPPPPQAGGIVTYHSARCSFRIFQQVRNKSLHPENSDLVQEGLTRISHVTSSTRLVWRSVTHVRVSWNLDVDCDIRDETRQVYWMTSSEAWLYPGWAVYVHTHDQHDQSPLLTSSLIILSNLMYRPVATTELCYTLICVSLRTRIGSLALTRFRDPCGGGLEYLHRRPASCKRLQNDNPVPGV